MVKDHSDSERGNPLPPHGLLFPINRKGSFICTIPDRIAHTTALVSPVVEHWLDREIAQWVHLMKDRSDDPSHHERMLLPQSYILLPYYYYLMMHSTYFMYCYMASDMCVRTTNIMKQTRFILICFVLYMTKIYLSKMCIIMVLSCPIK